MKSRKDIPADGRWHFMGRTEHGLLCWMLKHPTGGHDLGTTIPAGLWAAMTVGRLA